MSKILYRLSKILFLFLMAVVLILILFFQGMPYVCKKEFFLPNIVIATYILLVVGIAFLVCRLWMRSGHMLGKSAISDRVFDRAAACIALCLLAVDIYISYNILFINRWDPGATWEIALFRVNRDWGLPEWTNIYISRYPNNLLLLLLDTACLKLNGAVGVFTGDYAVMSTIILDCITISGACFLVYKVLTLHVKRKYAFGGFLAVVVLCGLSPWMTICYSDSLGILFPVLTYYLYTKPAGNTRRKWASQIFAVIICCIGYFIKPQCAIMLIAIVMTEFFNFCKERKLYQMARPLLLVALACVCLSVTSSVVTKQYESIGVELNPETKFGMTHFLMMGLNEADGGMYSQEDVDYSISFETSKERTAANIEKSIQRLRDMGFLGYMRHLSRKLLTTYHDGTFAWGVEGNFYTRVMDDVNTWMAPFLKSIFYSDGSRHEILKTIEQIAWIGVLLFAFAAGFVRQTEENQADLNILTLSIVGLTLFQMLFEVRARYLFLYVPVYCILATLGFENLWTGIQRKSSVKRKEKEKKHENAKTESNFVDRYPLL